MGWSSSSASQSSLRDFLLSSLGAEIQGQPFQRVSSRSQPLSKGAQSCPQHSTCISISPMSTGNGHQESPNKNSSFSLVQRNVCVCVCLVQGGSKRLFNLRPVHIWYKSYRMEIDELLPWIIITFLRINVAKCSGCFFMMSTYKHFWAPWKSE